MLRKSFLWIWILAITGCGSAEESKAVNDTGVVDQKMNATPTKSTDNYADELRQWLKDNKDKPHLGVSTMAGGNSFKDCPECPEMVNIPAGSFMMGSESGESDEKPAHRVEVSAFAMSRNEVTRKEFRQFVEATGYKTEIETGRVQEQKTEFTWRNVGFLQEETHPVVCVNWNDAVAYTKWLSQKNGRTYRLPTEAEWEYAARAGTTTDYWWGNTASHEYANYGKDECCSGLAQGKDRWEFTAPVGSFGPNPFGLYDTAGNVWEWTCSRYTNQYYGNELKCDITNEGQRVLRGGSWSDSPNGVRAATRVGTILLNRFSGGVRVVGFTR